jgi:propionyl-CoA synthetase
VFGGFASRELAARIVDCSPTVVLTAASSWEGPFGAGGDGPAGTKVVDYKKLLDDALELVALQDQESLPRSVLVWKRSALSHLPSELRPGRDYDWDEEVQRCASLSPQPCVAVPSTHPLYVLYTSGTTGKPKGIVRETGGHAVALRYSMDHIYGVGRGDRYWAASECVMSVGV